MYKLKPEEKVLCCPKCGAENSTEYGDTEGDCDELIQQCSCDECDFQWQEHFSYSYWEPFECQKNFKLAALREKPD